MKSKTTWLSVWFCLCAALAAMPARAAGVGETCAGIAGIQCDAGLACQFPEGQCNVADLAMLAASLGLSLWLSSEDFGEPSWVPATLPARSYCSAT